MMRLRLSAASPFVRKVRVAAQVLGLDQQIEIVPADVMDETDLLRSENPLGKIPVLILPTGETLFDSRVIVEYLDWLAPDRTIIPPAGPARWQVLRMQALADGILDAAILQIYEVRFRPEDKRNTDWMTYQAGKVERALSYLESNPPEISAVPDIGQITLACTLGYLDF
ncbi:MAG: glutathione S-transferase N-terminal domain-containing protein, partial [Fimbriimonadaceae bacterium]|nr:glutathione S-transferase N-terminal domain-containing protein [Alphaproteobacteria bacterium]